MSFEDRLPREIHDLDEVERAVRALRRADHSRLLHAALTLLRGFGLDRVPYDHRDLLNEALTLTVAGDRGWRKGMELVPHLIQVMRSVASHRRRRAFKEAEAGAAEIRESRRPRLPWEQGVGAVREDVAEPASGEPSPEAAAITRGRVREIERHFAGDAVASDVIACLARGMKGPEIQRRLGITRRQWVTTMERIRRRARRLEDSDAR